MFQSKGTTSGNRYIQNYQEETQGYGWFIYKWDLICTINQFILKGNLGVYKCCFHLYILW